MIGRQQADRDIAGERPGVVFGGIFRVPASGLTGTYQGMHVNILSATKTKGIDKYVIQGSTNLFTASRDTYAYISEAGVLTFSAVTNGAAKPKLIPTADGGIGERSQFIAKIVTDGSDITGVSDLREMAGADIGITTSTTSFVTASQGARYITFPCDARILHIQTSVTAALGGTDTGTVTAAIGENHVFTAVTNGVVTLAISAPVADIDEATPSAANIIRAGNFLRLTSLKTTTGGAADVFVVYERLP